MPPLNDLTEVYDMLADNVETWTDQWKREGLEQGLEQGLERGLEQGLEQGLERGLEQCLEQGLNTSRHILVRQARRRFGAAVAEQTERLLARVTDLQQLEELGDQLFLSADGKDWLGAVRRAGSDDDR
jgi:flagellar biosynthesis/type III secretory pathway protein FliH